MKRNLRRMSRVAMLGALLAVTFAVSAGRTQVLLAPTLTSVVADQSPSIAGAAVTFTAIVRPAGPGQTLPTGTVEFFSVLSSIGTATLTNTNGQAKAALTLQLQAGLYPISVKYHGDTTYAPSFSAPPIPQLVVQK